MTKRKKIEYLEEKVTSLTNTLDREIDHRGELEKELAKMTRLLQHHGKGPCCELSWMRLRHEAPKLYMYINDREYVIELSELMYCLLDRTTITFELDPVDKHFALFAVQNREHDLLHEFIIDYLNNKYLYSCSDLKEESISESAEYERGMNVNVRDLRECLEGLPDDMDVVIPVHDEDDSNIINGYRHVRTIGILENGANAVALGIATSEHGANMDNLMKINAGDVTCTKVLL